MSSFDPALARFRIVRIAGISPGYPRIYLEDILRNLRTRAPHIVMSMHWSEPEIDSVLALKPAAVGYTINRKAAGGVGSPQKLREAIRAGAERAAAAKIPFYVHGDLTKPLARQCLEDGVRMMSSSMIWPRLDHPAGAVKWPASNLNDEKADALENALHI